MDLDEDGSGTGSAWMRGGGGRVYYSPPSIHLPIFLSFLPCGLGVTHVTAGKDQLSTLLAAAR